MRRDARRIYVGKAKGDHAAPQDEIESILIAEARKGQRVVRLKGGDPFVFGRGGEELEALQVAGIVTHVIPGVTAALGWAAAAGVPLTHREHAQAVTFVTGQAKPGSPEVDWAALSSAEHTLAVYMGAGQAADFGPPDRGRPRPADAGDGGGQRHPAGRAGGVGPAVRTRPAHRGACGRGPLDAVHRPDRGLRGGSRGRL